MNRLLEVCVDCLASARAAIAGGADRLELCSALAIGGLTPYTTLLEQIREESSIPVRCLMRPRAGDFCYSPEEIDLMARQIRTLRAAGADGFVIGCLTPEGDLDGSAMASPVGITARSPAFSVTGASTQACRSIAAEPAVANCGRGISRPIFWFTALNFTSIGVILSKNDYK